MEQEVQDNRPESEVEGTESEIKGTGSRSE